MLLALYNVFTFISLGYVAKLLRLVGNRQSGILIGFLLNFSLPAQIFNGVYHAPFDTLLLKVIGTSFLFSLMGGMIILCIARFVLRLNRTTLVAIAILGTLGNTLFLGVPIVKGALGEEYSYRAILYDQLCTGIPLVIIAPLIFSLAGKAPFTLEAIGKRLFSNPLFFAMLTGIGCRFLPFSLPEPLLEPIKALAACATPVALFAIGVQVSFIAIKEAWRNTVFLLAFKMLIVPCIFIGFLKLTNINISNDWKMAILECGMPPLISAGAIIIQAGLDSRLAVSAISLGVLLSGVFSPLLLYLSG